MARPHWSDEGSPSFLHLLAVWVLVGWSLSPLGSTLADLSIVPISRIESGLLVGTLVVCTLWIAGFRPSIRDSVAYFLVEFGCSALLMLPMAVLFQSTIPPAVEVGFHVTTVTIAAVVVFTPVGAAIRDVVRRWATSILRLPTGTDAR